MKKLFLLCLLPSLVLAEEGKDVSHCLGISEDVQRLVCYDAVFKKKEVVTVSEEEEKSKWSYEEEKDAMRGATTYFASNTSLEKASFGFPYGDSYAHIVLRKDPKYGNDVMLQITKGQFNSCFDSCKITVKFDNQKLETYTMVESDSGSHDVLFISGKQSLKKFVNQLKKSNKVIIEASFFNHGREQFSFDVKGLKWLHF